MIHADTFLARNKNTPGVDTKMTPLLSHTLLPGCLFCSGRCEVVALLGVQFRSFGVVMNRVLIVAVSQVCVMRSLFVLFRLFVFRRLFVMVSRPVVVKGSVMVMLPGL